MNSSIRIAGHIYTPQRLLAVCVLASAALHALIFLLVPSWPLLPVLPQMPILEVVMVRSEAEVVVPALPPAAATPRPAEQPQRRTYNAPPVPHQPQTVNHALMVQPDTAAQSVNTVDPNQSSHVVPAPVASTIAPIASRVETISTQPEFNAAYLRNPPPRYPPAARRNGDEGKVTLKVLVSPAGVPVRVEVDQSSGSSPLDSAALDAVRAWRFVPARRGVQNVEAWVRVPVVFRLES